MIDQTTKSKQIVFFDGDCVFCSGSVQWITQHEQVKTLSFAALQTGFTREFLADLNIEINQLPDSILFWDGESLLVKSNAALEIAKYLKSPWKWIRIFSFLPSGFRNFFYDILARNRYDWFGKRESCFRPLPEEKNRFLSE